MYIYIYVYIYVYIYMYMYMYIYICMHTLHISVCDILDERRARARLEYIETE